MDFLTGGRFVLGLSTGDRPVEYPAFNVDFEDRGERYREAVEMIRTLHQQPFPRMETLHFGTFSGNLDLHPKPVNERIPIMAVGRSRQPIEWLARNVDAWIWAVDDDRAITEIVGALQAAAGDGTPPAYDYSPRACSIAGEAGGKPQTGNQRLLQRIPGRGPINATF